MREGEKKKERERKKEKKGGKKKKGREREKKKKSKKKEEKKERKRKKRERERFCQSGIGASVRLSEMYGSKILPGGMGRVLLHSVLAIDQSINQSIITF